MITLEKVSKLYVTKHAKVKALDKVSKKETGTLLV